MSRSAWLLVLAAWGIPTAARAAPTALVVDDPSGCLTAASASAAIAAVLGVAGDEVLAGVSVRVEADERSVRVTLSRGDVPLGERELDLGGLACDERNATVGLVVAVLAATSEPPPALRVPPRGRWEVRVLRLPQPAEYGADLTAPSAYAPLPRWSLGAAYRLAPGWLPGFGQGLEASAGLRFGAHGTRVRFGAEVWLPRDSSNAPPSVRVTGYGMSLAAERPFVRRPRFELAAELALASGLLRGAGSGGAGAQASTETRAFVRGRAGLTLALPLGRGLALTLGAAAVATPFSPAFVAESAGGEITRLHAPPPLTGSFALGLRWTRDESARGADNWPAPRT
ncbi:MAG: hypothetical protein AAGH15_20435 [Myxococcota bacterium]